MPKGREKGYKKVHTVIEDKSMSPYYIIEDERQFILMKQNEQVPYGYYTTFKNALHSLSKELLRDKNKSQKLNLSEYVKRYEEISNNLLNSLKL